MQPQTQTTFSGLTSDQLNLLLPLYTTQLAYVQAQIASVSVTVAPIQATGTIARLNAQVLSIQNTITAVNDALIALTATGN